MLVFCDQPTGREDAVCGYKKTDKTAVHGFADTTTNKKTDAESFKEIKVEEVVQENKTVDQRTLKV